MKSLKLETIKKFTSKSYNESDLKDLFLWFNSKNGLNKIGDLFEENWNNYNNTSEFEVDSEKILTNIRNEIRLNKTIQLKKNIHAIVALCCNGYFNNRNCDSLCATGKAV